MCVYVCMHIKLHPFISVILVSQCQTQQLGQQEVEEFSHVCVKQSTLVQPSSSHLSVDDTNGTIRFVPLPLC